MSAVCLIAGVSALLWSLAILASDGLDLVVFGITIRAHHAGRPAIAGIVVLALSGAVYGVRRVLAEPSIARRLAVAGLAAAVLIVGVARGTGVAGGSDSYGYLSQADLWRHGVPIVAQPWAAAVPWPQADRTFTPLGYRTAPGGGAIVPSYAVGLPLMMALVRTVAGYAAIFWIVPMCGAALVLLSYAAGCRLGSPATGLAAAWLVATNATLLSEITAPMSDVVAAAALASGCLLVLGPGYGAAATGGLASALALMVRPNLAPTVAVMTLWVAFRKSSSQGGLGRALIFAAAAAPGALVVAWANWRFYGSPLVSGYGDVHAIYHVSNITANLQRYAALLGQSQAWLALAGFALLAVPASRLWPGVTDRTLLAGVSLFVFSVVGPYLAYEPATGGGYLRFLLPCWPFVMAAAAALVLRPVHGFWSGAALALAIAAYGGNSVWQLRREGGLQDWRGEHRYPAAAALVRARTDPASIIFSDQHSGSARYYAGRMTIRYDMLDPAWLDRTVAWLAAHGAHPYALLDDGEVKAFRRRFAGQERVAALDTPLVVYHGAAIVHFCDLLRTPGDSRPPDSVVDRFDGPHFPAPVPFPPFGFR